MNSKKSLHSICAWTFNSGKGGFVPANIRPAWNWKDFTTLDVVKIIEKKIKPRLPDNIELGLEAHYDYEYNENNARELADALVDAKISLAMATPGAHKHFGYGGIASLDPEERKRANEYGVKAIELVYGDLKKAWHKDQDKAPSFVIWNGSFGYDLATTEIKKMYQYLKEGIANLCKYEEELGGKLMLAIEPKPNEGHPAMLIPTVASAIVLWKKIIEEFGLSKGRKGVNKEFGHSEMIGLDIVYDTVEEIDNNMLIHMHLNSQGYNDGITLGGPGKYDIDHGVKINGINIAVAGLILQSGYSRWKGHDMQARAYDNDEQAIDRVIRSILSWEACEKAAMEINYPEMTKLFEKRETGKVEDIMRSAVVSAQKHFNEMYKA